MEDRDRPASLGVPRHPRHDPEARRSRALGAVLPASERLRRRPARDGFEVKVNPVRVVSYGIHVLRERARSRSISTPASRQSPCRAMRRGPSGSLPEDCEKLVEGVDGVIVDRLPGGLPRSVVDECVELIASRVLSAHRGRAGGPRRPAMAGTSSSSAADAGGSRVARFEDVAGSSSVTRSGQANAEATSAAPAQTGARRAARGSTRVVGVDWALPDRFEDGHPGRARGSESARRSRPIAGRRKGV